MNTKIWLLSILSLFIFPLIATAQEVTLSWDQSPSHITWADGVCSDDQYTDQASCEDANVVSGYTLYYQEVPCDPDQLSPDYRGVSVEAGNVLTYIIPGLKNGQRYCFGVTAHDAEVYETWTVDTCSDPQYTDQASCEAAFTVNNSIYSNIVISDPKGGNLHIGGE